MVDPEEREEPIIRGMTWVHVSEGQWKDSTGYFHLSAIARAYKYRRLHIGDLLLMDALHQCWLNHSRFERHGFQRVEHVHYIEGRYLEYILPSDAEEWEDAANWKYARKNVTVLHNDRDRRSCWSSRPNQWKPPG